MEAQIIKTLEEYVRYVESISPQYSLSRGQEYERELLPSVLRKDANGMRLFSKKKSKQFIDDFKINSPMYIDNSNIRNESEWIVYAQHFGVPTCLLDFSYSHLVSLMFAIENAFSYDAGDEKNSVVWFLNPNELNLLSLNRTDIVNISEELIIENNFEYPFVVMARKDNERIAAQNGVFVYFLQDSDALERIPNAEVFLKKVLIPHDSAKNILKTLYTMGMRFNDIYPELSSVSKDIVLKNNVMELYRMEEEDGV